jgi:hypothetical protein
MAVNTSRSQNTSLVEGATDGKYRKVRPDTEVARMVGDEETMQDRASLHEWWNYGTITQEMPLAQRAVPGR